MSSTHLVMAAPESAGTGVENYKKAITVWSALPSQTLIGVGRKGEMSNRERQHRILCVTSSASHLETLQSVLHSANYKLVCCMTVDHAVAFCVDTRVSAIVLDTEFLTSQDWSVVQTLNSICPGVPVLVLAGNQDNNIPPGVDAVARTPELILRELQRLVDGHAASGTSGLGAASEKRGNQ